MITMGPSQVARNWPICCFLGVAPTRYPVFRSSIRSVACAIATHAAAPTMTEEMIAAESPIPLVITIRMVTAINVIPESGDQLVRPMHSDRITPATQIHSVASTAMMMPRVTPTSLVESMAITVSTIAARPTAM